MKSISKERSIPGSQGVKRPIRFRLRQPICVFFWQISSATIISSSTVSAMRGLSRYPINHQEDTHFRAQAIYQSYGIFKQRPDWMEIGQGASRSWAERTEIVNENGVFYYEDQGTGARKPMESSPLPWGNMDSTTGYDSNRDIWDTTERDPEQGTD